MRERSRDSFACRSDLFGGGSDDAAMHGRELSNAARAIPDSGTSGSRSLGPDAFAADCELWPDIATSLPIDSGAADCAMCSVTVSERGHGRKVKRPIADGTAGGSNALCWQRTRAPG